MARKKAAAAAKAPGRPADVYGQLLYDMWRDRSVLQRHLDAGHNIDTLSSRGSNLLCRACCVDVEALTKGSDTLVKQLLQAGADPNSRFIKGLTPLMMTRSPEVANCLLDHGADIARETDDGSFVLGLACSYGDPVIAKVLFKRGAAEQILKVNKSGHTPFSAAVNSGNEDVTLLLLQHLVLQPGFDINHSQLVAKQPLLCCAAVKGLDRVAEFALDHGADNDVTGPGGPPLILAVQNRNLSIVSLMCERGANVQTRFDDKNSLDEAVLRGDVKSVRALIKHGANVNAASDSNYASAVIQAAVLGHCDIVQLLLSAGASIDAALQHDH
jgi:ankyrin repeat protein